MNPTKRLYARALRRRYARHQQSRRVLLDTAACPASHTHRSSGGAPAGPNEEGRFLKPDAQFEVVWSNPVDLDDVNKRVYIQFDPACPVLVVRLKAVSQRPIKDDDSWRYREAGGWQRDRNGDALRRVVRLTPITPLPKGCHGSLVVPSELDPEGTSPYQRWRLATYGPFQLVSATCGWGWARDRKSTRLNSS